MRQVKIKIVFKILVFGVLFFALAIVWLNYDGPENLKNEAQAVSGLDACQQEYNQTAWLERVPPENYSADYTVYQYVYNSCPYKNDNSRPKLFQYGLDGTLAVDGNLGFMAGKLFLSKTYKFGGLATSTKTYLFDGYATSTVYYKIASSSTIFKQPFCVDPAAYNKYATSTIFDKIASSNTFIEQGNSTIFDQCVNLTEFASYANSTAYDKYSDLSVAMATTTNKGFAITYNNKKLLELYDFRQKDYLNAKFNSSAEASAVSANGVLNKINGTDARWVFNSGPYVGHCKIQTSQSGAPACTVGNCQGSCPSINCESIKPSSCKTDRWTWDENCSYYAPEMDKYQFNKTGEEEYECGTWKYTCYKKSENYQCGTLSDPKTCQRYVDNYPCPGQDGSGCNSCYKFVSKKCKRDLGYNKCISSKCVEKKQDCRVGRAILSRPNYNKVAIAFQDGSSLNMSLLSEDAPIKNSLEELIKNIENGIYNPRDAEVNDVTRPIYSVLDLKTIIGYEKKMETVIYTFDASLKSLLLNSVFAENSNSVKFDAYLSGFIGKKIQNASLTAPASSPVIASASGDDIANSGAASSAANSSPASASAAAVNNPKGYHDKSDCNYSWGWACDADDYSKPLQIHFYAKDPDGKNIFIGMTTIADQAGEAAIGAVCGGYTAHRFIFPTPNTLKNGKTYAIYAYAINTGSGIVNPLLADSPRAIFNCSQ
ncbi:MAG: hypothetical protein PHF50_01360 [Patescibacteria group bacterium]|nr:hypothetical protein [Patescibacteria group bacterium]